MAYVDQLNMTLAENNKHFVLRPRC